jgi:hypothetical protein
MGAERKNEKCKMKKIIYEPLLEVSFHKQIGHKSKEQPRKALLLIITLYDS